MHVCLGILIFFKGINVRYTSKKEVSELIRLTGSVLSLVVVSEGSASIKSRRKSKKGRAKAFYEKVYNCFISSSLTEINSKYFCYACSSIIIFKMMRQKRDSYWPSSIIIMPIGTLKALGEACTYY